MNTTPGLMVPPGTVRQALGAFDCRSVDNGVILTKVFLIEEAGRPPYQVQKAFVYPTMKEAIDVLMSDVKGN
jgi:hypothetical protein